MTHTDHWYLSKAKVFLSSHILLQVRAFIYGECAKPRCIYSCTKLKKHEEQAVEHVCEEGTYTYGSLQFPPDSKYSDIMVRESNHCAKPVGGVILCWNDCSLPSCVLPLWRKLFPCRWWWSKGVRTSACKTNLHPLQGIWPGHYH